MRHLSVRPTFTYRGRKAKGLRGWSGKPLHPPLTDVPVGAYVLAAGLDVVSVVFRDQPWARDFFRAATFVLIGGAAVSLLTALTGFLDWLRSTEAGTQARRTANAHAWTMVTVTVLVLADIALRLSRWDESSTPVAVLVLSILAAVLTVAGGALGGSMVFDYGFNVETAGDSPVWHRSERDVFPGEDDRGEPLIDLTGSDAGEPIPMEPVPGDAATAPTSPPRRS